MKQFLFGVLLTIVVNSVATDVAFNGGEKESEIGWFVSRTVLAGDYVRLVLHKKCVDQKMTNGHGWKIDSMADYFGCDNFQRWLNK